MPTGESPLKHHPAFAEVACPNCGGKAHRETDTMDTFVDSAWYWFRYLSPHDDARPLDPELVKRWTPVDVYTGGVEHAILHLLYARFFTTVLRDLGLVDVGEPCLKLRNQGLLLGAGHEEMWKAGGTVVNPDGLGAQYRAGAVRTFPMCFGPWDQGGPWNYQGIEGVYRFLHRVWTLVVDQEAEPSPGVDVAAVARELRRAVHK